MSQESKTFEEVREIVFRVKFRYMRITAIDKNGTWFLQVQYEDNDVSSGENKEQHGRKWYISPYATESEIVQTAFKAVLTSQEHIAREWFTYKGRRVFQPHYNVNDLIKLCDEKNLDLRK